MPLYKQQSREQRITDLIGSFSMQKPSSAKQVYLIDRSFHHAEINRMSVKEKEVINQTIDNFVRKEERSIEMLQKEKERSAAKGCRRKVVQKVRKFQQSKSAHFFNSQSPKIKHLNLSFPNKHIFIERKYNPQIAYQLHTFLQAKRIEDDRSRIRQQLECQPSPLLHQALKKMRDIRTTMGGNRDSHFPSNGPSIHQEYQDEKLARTLSKMQAQKEKEEMRASRPQLHPSQFSSLGIFQKQQQRYLKRSTKVK